MYRRSTVRRWGRSLKGKRSTMRLTWVRGKRYTIEGALTLDGLLVYEIMEGLCAQMIITTL